jgi:hypothetical protein
MQHFPHAWQRAMRAFGDEHQLMPVLRREMAQQMHELRGEILMDEKISQGKPPARASKPTGRPWGSPAGSARWSNATM